MLTTMFTRITKKRAPVGDTETVLLDW